MRTGVALLRLDQLVERGHSWRAEAGGQSRLRSGDNSIALRREVLNGGLRRFARSGSGVPGLLEDEQKARWRAFSSNAEFGCRQAAFRKSRYATASVMNCGVTDPSTVPGGRVPAPLPCACACWCCAKEVEDRRQITATVSAKRTNVP